MKLLKFRRNPSRKGYICTMFLMTSQGMREDHGVFVIVADSEAEAAQKVKAAMEPDNKLKFILTPTLIFS